MTNWRMYTRLLLWANNYYAFFDNIWKKHLEEYEKTEKQHKEVEEKAAKKHMKYRYQKGIISMGSKVKYSVSYRSKNLQYRPPLEASS